MRFDTGYQSTDATGKANVEYIAIAEAILRPMSLSSYDIECRRFEVNPPARPFGSPACEWRDTIFQKQENELASSQKPCFVNSSFLTSR